MPAAAFAQSTGTVETEEETIVVTGTRARDVGGFQVPDTTKAKAVIDQELIEKQAPGQTILNVINLVPGVNFTNSDAYGNSGGSIRIRGFDGNRISLTFDGVPLNDSGNYAIFASQQLDPELVEQVNVGLGVTDVDSPTASAAGGTVNYRSMIPTEDFGARLAGSLGDFGYYRLFGKFDSGALTSMGTRAWIAGSRSFNDQFKGPGELSKYQANAKIYQPIGSNGDFVSLSGHYNRSRNNFYRNPSVNDLRTVFGGTEIIANNLATADNPILIGYFDTHQEHDVLTDPRLENDAVCLNNNRTFSGCSNYYNVRFNPSNTGNSRGQSRFTLRDGLLLTVDPSYQYVLANGGGTFTIAENSRRAKGSATTSPGVDYNGDGDVLDTVRFYTPNNTNTNRLGLTSSLIWDVAADHRVRVAYTFDRAHHRQTGEWGYMEDNGDPESVFGGRNATPVLTADGFQLQQRDRTSIAMLNQISGQYIGKFFDQALRIEVGVRRPFFKRKLDTNCPIQASDGFAYCTSEPILARGTPLVAQPSGTPDRAIPIFVNQGDPLPTGTVAAKYNFVYAPFNAKYKFGKALPNIGFTYRISNPISFFGSYAKGFSSPRTDNLYRAPLVDVDPEETDAFDLGARYTSRRVQGQIAAWKIDYSNRIVSSFNQELGISLDRNVGEVKSYGFDGSLAFQPTRSVTLLALASYIHAELKENVEFSTTTSATPPAGLIFCDGPPTAGNPVAATCAPTAGKMVAETPKWQFGGRANFDFGPLSLGVQAKRVSSRFATDVNDVKVKGYTLVDFDARFSMADLGLEKTYLQVNFQNVFDVLYFGNLSTQINVGGGPSFAVGSPATVSATLNVGL
jgi:iron complex outermembrane receptor protein